MPTEPTNHHRRPRLLPLVAGATLLLVALSGVGLALVLTQHVGAAAIRTTVAGDQALVADFASRSLRIDDLAVPLSPGRTGLLERQLAGLAESAGLRSVVLLTPAGTLIAASGDELPGSTTAAFAEAAAGRTHASITRTPGGLGARPPELLVEYLPLRSGDEVAAVIAVARDATPITGSLDATRRDVLLLVLGGAASLSFLLVLIFRAAQERLNRQTDQLIESTRRDPLTGLLNHGAAVATLAELLTAADGKNETVSVAVLDIDNFRLLNEVHGHAAGDTALRTVAAAIEADTAIISAVGRYGPDEFVLISKPGEGRQMEAAIHELQLRLEKATLRFGGSEPLPVTVSAGIGHFPFHAKGANEMLSAANVALAEAKASGGDAVRTANAWTNDPADRARTTFDVFQGLVNAVDTKDRYTKRHSEDVARYALFLADRIELEEKLRDPLRMAALLHDVGKIGIPDEILRKPGPLTPHEQEIVKQHVALGDLIVRDLPNLWIVRAGIRHHHERWDGAGYLDGLAGERIPLIARVLAVADAFSAMTTTRPYRKALAVDEALRRLEDAAGSQLEERLAISFVEGMRTASDAPLPHTRTIRLVTAEESAA